MMKNNDKTIINAAKALDEKETMQKHFIVKHGHPSYVLATVIEHFKDNL